MHLHLVRVPVRSSPGPRPAKLVVLESRRKARLELARPPQRPSRPAA